MFRHKPYALRAALLFVSLLFGSVSAFAQKTSNPLLPNVNLGLSAPQVGVGLNVAVPQVVAPRTLVGVPALPVPMVTATVAPPIASTPSVSAAVGGQGAALSVNVPSVSGLTSPLGANVNVNTGGSTPLLAVGVDVSGSTVGVGVGDGGIRGAPPAPNFPASGPSTAAPDQLLQQRLALLPTCR